MALQRDARYPGRWTAASAGHPQGAFKNRTAPGSLDGSYIEQDWANDWDGFFGSLLTSSAITANGTVDAVGSSQYFSALQAVIRSNATGRLLRTSIYTRSAGSQFVSVDGAAPTTVGAGTFTSLSETSYHLIEVLGGGGGGGSALSTTSTQFAAGGGGGGGGASINRTSGTLTGIVVTVGAGGGGGIAGSSSSFGASVSASGGAQGSNGAASASIGVTAGGAGGTSTGANQYASDGAFGGVAVLQNIGNLVSGPGGSNYYGAGAAGRGAGNPGVGFNAVTPGGGGGGALNAGTSATTAGGNGGNGMIIVREYK